MCVLRFSWENEGEWSNGEFDPHNDEDGQGELEFFQVWAILQYLHAEWEAANLDDWEMECLTEGKQRSSSLQPFSYFSFYFSFFPEVLDI